jgi:hypothetical protein
LSQGFKAALQRAYAAAIASTFANLAEKGQYYLVSEQTESSILVCAAFIAVRPNSGADANFCPKGQFARYYKSI